MEDGFKLQKMTYMCISRSSEHITLDDSSTIELYKANDNLRIKLHQSGISTEKNNNFSCFHLIFRIKIVMLLSLKQNVVYLDPYLLVIQF